jgi:hypothetical protein
MAIAISSVKFSFHRFEPVHYLLPAYRAFDAAFQFNVDGYLAIESLLFLGVCNNAGMVIPAFSGVIQASILAYKYKIPNSIFNLTQFTLYSIASNDRTVNYNSIPTYTEFKQIMFDDFGYQIGVDNTFVTKGLDEIVITWAVITTPIVENTLQPFWGRGYVAAIGDLIYPWFKPGDCFSYCIIDEDGIVVGRTNKLKVVAKDTFTSLVSYRNNEDAYGFLYRAPDTINKVRLKLYLSRPQWPEKKSVYIKSDGYHKLLASFIEEQYELRTEHIPAKLHRFIKMAFAHDQVIIDCPSLDETPVEIINSDSYNPTWDADLDLTESQGKSTITVAAFGYTNSNCEKPGGDCSPPLMTIGEVTDTSVNLGFQIPGYINKILLNYRKVGDPFWQTVQIPAATTYLLLDLFSAAEYEIKAASDCGDGFGSFGRLKTFTTTGVSSCTAPNTLTMTGPDDSGTYSFTVNLPLPAPANIDLFMTRPDGSVVIEPIPTTGFTVNPFAFTYTDPDTVQYGLTRFRVRSVCGVGDYSSYSNELISNYQAGVILTNIQYDFSLFSGHSGSMAIKKNGTSIVNAISPVTGSFASANGDFIEINISSTSGTAAHLVVYATDIIDLGGTGVVFPMFDSASSTSPIQSFSFTTEYIKTYFITASI